MNSILEEYDVNTIKQGYAEKNGAYHCLVCGEIFTTGEVYPVNGRFFEAECAAAQHVASLHSSRFEQLLESNSKYNTLTENQRQLMKMLYEGKTDAEIAAETGVASATVRRQRFMFREKAKQAKMYLVMYEMMNDKKQPAENQLLPVHEGAKMLDERFAITQKENEKIISNAFESTTPLVLKHFPVKEKKKVAILNVIATQFDRGVDYTEKQVNETLKAIYHDYVTLRRYLIEYGYLDRTNDGSRYWVI